MSNGNIYHKYLPELAEQINDNLTSTYTQQSDITTALQGYHNIYQVRSEDKRNALEVNLQLARIMQNRSNLFAPIESNDDEVKKIQEQVSEYLQKQYKNTFNNAEIVIDWDARQVLGANMNGRFIPTKDLSKIALLDFTSKTFQTKGDAQKITEKIALTIDSLLAETNNAIETLKPALSLTDISTIMGTDSGEAALKQIQSLLKNLRLSFNKTNGDIVDAANVIKEALYEKVEDASSAIQRYKPRTSKLRTLGDDEIYNAINKGVLAIANTPYDNKSPYVLVRETLNLINRMVSGITAIQQLQGDLLESMVAAICQAALVGTSALQEKIRSSIKGDRTITIKANDQLLSNAVAQVSKQYGDAFWASFNQSNSRSKVDVECKLGSGNVASMSLKNYNLTKYVSDSKTKQTIKKLAKVHVVKDTNLFVLLQFIDQAMLHDFVTLSQVSTDKQLRNMGEDFAKTKASQIVAKRKNIRQNIFDLIIAGAVSGARQDAKDIVKGTGDFARLFVINDTSTGNFICVPTNKVIRRALQMELLHTKGDTHAASIKVGTNSKEWYGDDSNQAAPVLKTSPSANRLFTDPASVITALREVKIMASLGGQVLFPNH